VNCLFSLSELEDDPIVSAHITNLYENLLEKNLARILEPFSRVQLPHVAKLIDLPLARVEAKCARSPLLVLGLSSAPFHVLNPTDSHIGIGVSFHVRLSIRLSEMVLDKKLNGILDQGAGDLILFDQVETDVRLV
jgi:26S proteasome regulatory subunit N6